MTASTGSPMTGLFSSGEGGRGPEVQEMVIWDRLPRQDLDLEMPSKLEWFSSPEGSKTVLHPTRYVAATAPTAATVEVAAVVAVVVVAAAAAVVVISSSSSMESL
jgi:hypothetical protein